MDSDSNYLTGIPVDNLLIILDFLPIDDLISIKETSKDGNLNNIITQYINTARYWDQVIWREFGVDSTAEDYTPSESFYTALQIYFNMLQQIEKGKEIEEQMDYLYEFVFTNAELGYLDYFVEKLGEEFLQYIMSRAMKDNKDWILVKYLDKMEKSEAYFQYSIDLQKLVGNKDVKSVRDKSFERFTKIYKKQLDEPFSISDEFLESYNYPELLNLAMFFKSIGKEVVIDIDQISSNLYMRIFLLAPEKYEEYIGDEGFKIILKLYLFFGKDTSSDRKLDKEFLKSRPATLTNTIFFWHHNKPEIIGKIGANLVKENPNTWNELVSIPYSRPNDILIARELDYHHTFSSKFDLGIVLNIIEDKNVNLIISLNGVKLVEGLINLKDSDVKEITEKVNAVVDMLKKIGKAQLIQPIFKALIVFGENNGKNIPLIWIPNNLLPEFQKAKGR